MGLYDALSEHYNFYRVYDPDERAELNAKGEWPPKNPAFERLCDHLDLPCNRESFGYAVRRLRIALLLEKFRLREDGERNSSRPHVNHAETTLKHDESGSRKDPLKDFGKVYHFDYD